MAPISSAVLPALQESRVSGVARRETQRLRRFIGRRVADVADADDILQDVLFELVEADRLMKPIEQVTAWMFQVARNRITDLFRKRKSNGDSGNDGVVTDADDLRLQDLLPSRSAGPDAAYAHGVLIDELNEAIEELPPEQREVLIAHELEGRSFQEMAQASGISINTLLSRKRYAILQLRRRLQSIYDEFGKG